MALPRQTSLHGAAADSPTKPLKQTAAHRRGENDICLVFALYPSVLPVLAYPGASWCALQRVRWCVLVCAGVRWCVLVPGGCWC